MIKEATSLPSFIPVAVNDSGGKHLACPAQLLKCHLCPGTVRNWNCSGAQNGEWECSSSAAVSQLSSHKQLQGRVIEAWERICRCQFAS